MIQPTLSQFVEAFTGPLSRDPLPRVVAMSGTLVAVLTHVNPPMFTLATVLPSSKGSRRRVHEVGITDPAVVYRALVPPRRHRTRGPGGSS